jgi:hypothetical protein
VRRHTNTARNVARVRRSRSHDRKNRRGVAAKGYAPNSDFADPSRMRYELPPMCMQAGYTRHGPLAEKGRSLNHPVKGQPSVPSGSADERAPTSMSASLSLLSSSASVLTSFAFSPAFGLALADNVPGARASRRGRRLAAS